MAQGSAAWAGTGRADLDAVDDLLQLGDHRFTGDHRAHPVAGNGVGLGEGIERDQVFARRLMGEEAMRLAERRVEEVAVGLVEDEIHSARDADLHEFGEALGG